MRWRGERRGPSLARALVRSSALSSPPHLVLPFDFITIRKKWYAQSRPGVTEDQTSAHAHLIIQLENTQVEVASGSK